MVVAPLSSIFLLWFHRGRTHFMLAAIHTYRLRRVTQNPLPERLPTYLCFSDATWPPFSSVAEAVLAASNRIPDLLPVSVDRPGRLPLGLL